MLSSMLSQNVERTLRVKDIYQYPVRVDYRELPQSNVLYEASVTDNHLGRDTTINFELELVPQDVITEFTANNIIFESNAVGQDMDGKVSNIENFAKEFKIRKLIEEGVIMAVMAGPIEKNPVIGFDLSIKRIESQNCFFKQIKGFIVQKMIIRAIQEALKKADCVVKEPRMKFELSLYRFFS
jgi:translation elongation factor EF-G